MVKSVKSKIAIVTAAAITLSALFVVALAAGPSQMSERERERYFEYVRQNNKYESVRRDQWQKPLEVMARMGDMRGKVVADIGSGTGYFTVRLAPFAGRVIAVDVTEGYLRFLRSRVDELSKSYPNYTSRIEIRRADYHDAKLKPGEVDIILISDTYHHLERRTEYFRHLKPALRPGGKIVITDWLEMRRPVGPPPGHGLIPPEQMVAEIEAAGYRVEVDNDLLDYQVLMIAWPK